MPVRACTLLPKKYSVDDNLEDENDEEPLTYEHPPTKKNLKRRSCRKVEPTWCKRKRRSSVSKSIKHINGVKTEKQIIAIDKQITKSDKKVTNSDKRIVRSDKPLCNSGNQTKKDHTSRWSTERYKVAVESMFKIMKDAGAVSGNTLKRTELRPAARAHIGDTGLLDHLLKHMDGMVAPSGLERFRRRHSFDGTMEYWLENADLVNIRMEVGIDDPFWVPPAGWKPGDPVEDLDTSIQLNLLKKEMAEIKRDFQKLVSKKHHEKAYATHSSSYTNQKIKDDRSFIHLQGIPDNLIRWKAKIDQELMKISSSLSNMQENSDMLEQWKAKLEQKLREISDSINNFQVMNHYNSFNQPASDCWKDWFGSTDLINLPNDDVPSWLEGSDLIVFKDENLPPWLEIPIKQEPAVPTEINSCSATSMELEPKDMLSEHKVCAEDLESLKEEMKRMKRDIQEQLIIAKQEDDSETNVTSVSSFATNVDLDPDNSVTMLQDMYKEVVNWKIQIEQQVMEISQSLISLQA